MRGAGRHFALACLLAGALCPAVPQAGRAGSGGPQAPRVIDRLADIAPAVGACWQPPAGLAGFPEIEVTARFSLRRDGTLIGTPRITFATSGVALRARELLTQAALEAIAACTPLRITPELGAAIAGRPFAIRFIYRGPPGRGA